MIARFILAACELWSVEFRICVAFGAGVTLGVLVAASALA